MHRSIDVVRIAILALRDFAREQDVLGIILPGGNDRRSEAPHDRHVDQRYGNRKEPCARRPGSGSEEFQAVRA